MNCSQRNKPPYGCTNQLDLEEIRELVCRWNRDTNRISTEQRTLFVRNDSIFYKTKKLDARDVNVPSFLRTR